MVFENVELPLTYRGMGSSERRQRVTAALERVGYRNQHWDVEPDVMTFAKGMANGAPIGWTPVAVFILAYPLIVPATRGSERSRLRALSGVSSPLISVLSTTSAETRAKAAR